MLRRELPTFPDAPMIIRENESLRAIMTDLVFGEPEILAQRLPKYIDTVFCFGSNEGHRRQGQSLAALFNSRAHRVGQLIFTSGMDWKLYDSLEDLGQSIAVATWRAMDAQIPKETMIGIEAVSINTKENAEMGWAAMPRLPGNAIVNSAMTFHQGRCHRTLLAEAERRGWSGDILYYPYQALELERSGAVTDVNRADWWHSDVASSRVLGEAQRIYKYGERGDLLFLSPDKERFGFLQRAGLELVT